MFENKELFKNAFVEKMQVALGISVENSSMQDKYFVLASMVKEVVNKRYVQTDTHYFSKNEKQVFYFSLEFLMGKLLDLYLLYLGARDICKDGLSELGIDFEFIESLEPEAGLGNGGLGRLAACFLDSMAALSIPGHGCGIRYRYGLFSQKIIDGYQVEVPDNWLSDFNVWETKRKDKSIEVRFGGNITSRTENGKLIFDHENYDIVMAVPYDTPILGYQNINVNTLRLWSAESKNSDFDFASFSRGDYIKAMEYKNQVEAISEVLYPDDSNQKNRLLRLKQEYFLVSAGLQSIIRRFKKNNKSLTMFPEKVALHINDTHPALIIPEMMRILIDNEGFEWDKAWDITRKSVSYTNHTIMPEALEKWPVEVLSQLLPRIFMIISEINERFCKELWKSNPGNWDLIKDMSIIADDYVKMAHLAVIGSYSVNGVAEVHTQILKKDVLKNFYKYYPYKFNNKTNGIAHRRWLIKSNPTLTKLINSAIGESWVSHPADLVNLVKYSYDTNSSFQNDFLNVKSQCKINLADYIYKSNQIIVNPESIFDVQVKRIHAYKRQLLNILHIMNRYKMLKENPNLDIFPRTYIFSGKAAPSYYYAKKIIKLINVVGDVVNNDKLINDKIKVVFLPNYCVSLAELIIPAADISEQISTASKEASGTGNMKFMMNGAVTLGTLDGANIEIYNEVGEENIITFGLNVDEVLNYYKNGGYCSRDYYNNDIRLRNTLDNLIDGYFYKGLSDEFHDIFRSLLDYNDEFFLLKDFEPYNNAHDKAEKLYRNSSTWAKMAINNIAFSGKFGCDETISKYADGIWKVKQAIIKST